MARALGPMPVFGIVCIAAFIGIVIGVGIFGLVVKGSSDPNTFEKYCPEGQILVIGWEYGNGACIPGSLPLTRVVPKR